MSGDAKNRAKRTELAAAKSRVDLSEVQPGLSRAQALAGLRSAGEATRLRILALLAAGELNVKDLTQILGQSQPRISRHLKLMAEAGLIRRFREGSWVFFRLADSGAEATLAHAIVASLDPTDLTLARDRARASAVQKARAEAAQAYFDAHASEWDRIRALHVTEREVEAAIDAALGHGRFTLLVDLGTGTGRILELFAPRANRALGFDLNRAMLAYARMKLERAGLFQAQVRHGDLHNVPLPDGAADAVVLHQVLHFLDDPAAAVAEAARLLAPGGRLLVVDFAPHELEFLREQSAHRRLGFARDQLGRLFENAGLKLERFRELKPAPSDGKLTVSLWLGLKPALAAKKRKAGTKVEAAA
ncbi:MAG: metalloregulator ArsR/SmtB family transcription factor [Methyloceanibacter sp.]|nr:metalloregulator ArsR/SmtB family transcription factor [Methyloceanibacter sp.]